MKKNNKIKKSVSVLAFLFVCALSVILSSCSDELDIQQSYPFKVETMPVPKDIVRGQTVEIRCELKAEGKFDGTIYTIRYFQHDGKGSLRMENGTVFQPNDRYLLIKLQKGPDGTPYVPRKNQPVRNKKGRIKRKMFVKLRTNRFMKATGSESAAVVEFASGVQRIARVHQLGLKDVCECSEAYIAVEHYAV